MIKKETIFVGREAEQKILQTLLKDRTAQLVTIMGRRRIGKTVLIKKTFEGQIDFHFTGVKNGDKANILREFAIKLAAQSKSKKAVFIPTDWMEAFRLLKKYLLSIRKRKKKVVFLDEFPWMDNHKSGFLSAFEFFWNDWAVDQNIAIIICGSSTAWMMQHVMNNRAGLHNRVTKYIQLQPFTLNETKQLFQARGIQFPNYEIVKLYMALGGVPYYLNETRKGESAIQNIDRILFSEKSTLKHEFQNLYRALFDPYEKYEAIVKVLSQKQRGLTRQEIITATRLPNGGSLTRMLNDLEACSFIKSFMPFGKEKKETMYRLIDEYTVFYFQFNPLKHKEGSFIQWSTSSKYKSWAGFAFESLCLKHIDKLKSALGIAGVFTTESSFYVKGDKTQNGFQMDLLIDRNDNAINICEMKFYNSEMELNRKDSELLRNRRELFRNKTKTRKYLMNTLITTYGLKPSINTIGVIDKVIVMDELF
jgi:uncharacterized protein